MHPDNADFEILFERWMTFNDFVSFIAISWFVCCEYGDQLPVRVVVGVNRITNFTLSKKYL